MVAIITRRNAIAGGAGLAVAGLWDFEASAIPVASVEPPKLPIEKGAALRVLRPAKFVDPDETIFRENIKTFSDEMKVPVRVDFVGWEDLRPQTAVAANTGAGADVIIGWPDDPHLYADKLLDLSDVAEYLGQKYGGWYFLAERYGKKWGTNNWISIPMGGSGAPVVYRQSWVKEAGFDRIPADFDQFLALCRNLKKNGHPVGFALGNAVGDANGYCSWMLWGHNGYLVDEIDSYRAIKEKIAIPLSGAEHEYTRWGMKRFIDARALDILQPDIYWAGGLSETMKIAAYATAHDLMTIPHGHSTPAGIHFSVTQSPIHTPYQEYLVKWNAIHQHFLAHPVLPVQGQIHAPERPGLGMDLDPSKIEEETEAFA